MTKEEKLVKLDIYTMVFKKLNLYLRKQILSEFILWYICCLYHAV